MCTGVSSKYENEAGHFQPKTSPIALSESSAANQDFTIKFPEITACQITYGIRAGLFNERKVTKSSCQCMKHFVSSPALLHCINNLNLPFPIHTTI